MCTFMCCTFFVGGFPVTIGLRGLINVFNFSEDLEYFRASEIDFLDLGK